jgi:hypothetical protein
MARRLRTLRVLPLLAVATVLSAPPPAEAAVTIGSDLSGVPALQICTTDPCTVLQTVRPPGATLALTSLSDGVIVRWRLRTLTAGSTTPKLRVLRPNGGDQYLAVSSSTPVTPSGGGAISTFETRQPVLAGDAIGVDTAHTVFALAIGGEVKRWGSPPPLADGTSSSPTQTHANYELLLNADIEADADKDGYGDETQDLCPTDATVQTTCPVPTAPPASSVPTRDVTPPGAVLSAARSQRLNGLAVSIVSNENGTAAATARVNVPNASRSYRLRRVRRSLVANSKRKLRLVLRGRAARRAVRGALRRGRRLRVRVTVTAHDKAGNATTRKRSIRLRR